MLILVGLLFKKSAHFLNVMYTYHSAAERPEPPHEKQGQKEEQRQQGDQKDGAIKLETGRRHSWGRENKRT